MFFYKRALNRERLDRVAVLYLACKFFGSLYFTYPIFVEYASQAITPVQIGLFFSAAGLCGLVAEIPTGIIADKRSRKFSGLAGMSLLTIAPLVVFFGHTFGSYLAAAVFYGLGGAFLNGALDSLVYDHKNITKEAYRRMNALEISFGQAGILVGAAVGGLLFSAREWLPFIAQAIAGIACIGVIANMQESYKDGYEQPVSTHRRHFIESVRHLFATRYLQVVVVMGVTFSVMLGMCIQLVHEAAMIAYGFDATARGLLIAGGGVATLLLLNLALLRMLKSDTARILFIGFGAVAAYVLMGIGVVPLFLAGYLLWCCLNATSSFIRLLIQDQVPGSHRSTILSSFKTLAVLLGLCGSVATGVLVQSARTPRVAYIVFAAISCLVLLPCMAWLVAYLKRHGTLAQD